MNVLYTLGRRIPKHASVRQHEFWYKCNECINFQFTCTDLDITQMLIEDHNAIVHYDSLERNVDE